MLVTGERSGSVLWTPLGAQAVHWCFSGGPNSPKRSALVYKGEGNALMSEIRIRNGLRGLA